MAHNPAIEIYVVDMLSRKGFRFKGMAQVRGEGAYFEELVALYRERGSSSVKRHVVVKVEAAASLISPDYDQGLTEKRSQGEVACLLGQALVSLVASAAAPTPAFQARTLANRLSAYGR